MVRIPFTNYTVSHIDSSFRSHFCITDVNRSNFRNSYYFRFTLEPEEESLLEQAELFAQTASSYGLFEGRYFNYADYSNSTIDILRQTYIYSYLKAIYYGYGKVFNLDYANFPVGGNSLVYEGHKYIYDIINNGAYIQSSLLKSNTTVQLDEDREVLNRIENFQCYNDYINPVTNRIHVPMLEEALCFLATNKRSKDKLSVVALKTDTVYNTVFDDIPLGNLCYSSDMLSLLYLPDRNFPIDRVSFFWNKAVMVKLVSQSTIDVNDSIYNDTLVTNVDTITLGDEVESITGFNPYKSDREIDFQRPRRYSPNSGSPRNNNNNNWNRPNNNNNNNNQSGPDSSIQPTGPNSYGSNSNNKASPAAIRTTRGSRKNIVVQVKDNTITFLKNRRNDIITRENVNDVMSILGLQFDRRLSKQEKRDMIGQTIANVFSRYGLDRKVVDKRGNDILLLENDYYHDNYKNKRYEAYELIEDM